MSSSSTWSGFIIDREHAIDRERPRTARVLRAAAGTPAVEPTVLYAAQSAGIAALAMADRILMIEDDTQLSKMVAEYLGKMGMAVTARDTAAAGLFLLRRETFDAVVLDVMLPDLDGFEVCKRLRADSDVPIIMLTARGDDADRIVGLEIGADDYLPKPFNPRELLARLRAILRRARPGSAARAPALRFGSIEVDRAARSVRVEGEAVSLTSYQFDLLCALAENAGRVMSRDSLMTKVRGHDLEAFDRSIDVHISKIRAAIEPDPKQPRRIITIRGVGYVFAKSDAEDD